MKNHIYILVGGSGSGKTSIVRKIQELCDVEEFVSCTTREMRPGEKEGETYYYLDKEAFDKIDKIQYSYYAGNHYCLSKQEVENKLSKGKNILFIANREGALAIKKAYPNKTFIIYLRMDESTMFSRLSQRGDTIENIEKRIQYAKETGEFEDWDEADFILNNEDGKLLKTVQTILYFIGQTKIPNMEEEMEILAWYEGPLMFLQKTKDKKQLYFGYLLDLYNHGTEYLYCLISEDDADDLKNNLISIRDLILSSSYHFSSLDMCNYSCSRFLTVNDIPEDCLSDENTYLN